ncbi:MAG: hypothetical protein R3Y63_09210 [Eubacteriales bacterium]
MTELEQLQEQRDSLLAEIREIEVSCEGIENEANQQRASELNEKKVVLQGEKKHLDGQVASISAQLSSINNELQKFSSTSTDRILEEIDVQRWFFFKNKPNIMFDKTTGLLWNNPQGTSSFYKHDKSGNGRYTYDEYTALIDVLSLDGFTSWEMPSMAQMRDFVSSFTPLVKLKDIDKFGFYPLVDTGRQIYLKSETTCDFNSSSGGQSGHLIICSPKFATNEYISQVTGNTPNYSEKERLQFTLDLFVEHDLMPIFDDPEVTALYNEIYFRKPELVARLTELQEAIAPLEAEFLASQQVVLLSSTFDYKHILNNYPIEEIDHSVIQYAKAVQEVANDFMDKLAYYEEENREIMEEFTLISLKLSKKYEDSSKLMEQENELLEKRQYFFQKHFELGMDKVKTQLLNMKAQGSDLEQRIANINEEDKSISLLAQLEKEERAGFEFIVENMANIVRSALIKIEFFQDEKNFVGASVNAWEQWEDDYKIFKSTRFDELTSTCTEDEIEPEIFQKWLVDWQKTRYATEQLLVPLVEFALKGHLLSRNEGEVTTAEKIFTLLQEHKQNIDKFYLEEQKGIYQKFVFQAGGDVQTKFEAESELYKILSAFQEKFTGILFALDSAEERMFLLNWAKQILNIQVEEILSFVADNDLSAISEEVLKEFSRLKQQNFTAFLSDSKAYSTALKEREKEFNSLVFKMRKDLAKG